MPILLHKPNRGNEMTNRAIELAKEFNAYFCLEFENGVVHKGYEFSEEELQAFYEAAKRDGMIEMRERAVNYFEEAHSPEEFRWNEVVEAIRALEVTK